MLGLQAEGLFSKARIASPYLIQYMDIYSTLLWHLHRPIPLSALAQDLQSISPQSPQAWIATGNIFSHLENHAAALRCFKRASQVDDGCVYAFTLSGHECVALEEWENAIGFYREAVRRDRRHYNAW
jgi:anaphase-promoting complex subunit 3